MSAVMQPAEPIGQILLGVPAEEYQRRELGVATSGVLQRLRTKTPAHIKAWVSQRDEETPAKAFGKAYHCAVFEPEVFAATYCKPPVNPPRDLRHLRDAKKPGESTLESIAFWDAWDAEHHGRIQLSQDFFELIEEMMAALRSHPLVNKLLFVDDGDNEVTMRWVDEETGVPCKARADRWVHSLRVMLDLKTTDDASDAAFRRSIENYGYHIQHAHYSEGARACGESLDEYLLIAQEKYAPYLPRIFRVGAASEARGFELRERGLQILKRCRETDTWPGYTGITEIDIAPWALKD